MILVNGRAHLPELLPQNRLVGSGHLAVRRRQSSRQEADTERDPHFRLSHEHLVADITLDADSRAGCAAEAGRCGTNRWRKKPSGLDLSTGTLRARISLVRSCSWPLVIEGVALRVYQHQQKFPILTHVVLHPVSPGKAAPSVGAGDVKSTPLVAATLDDNASGCAVAGAIVKAACITMIATTLNKAE